MTVRTTHLPARGHLAALLRVSTSSPLTEFLCLSHEGKCCEAAVVRLTELLPPLAVNETTDDTAPTGRSEHALPHAYRFLRILLFFALASFSLRCATP
ncbi:hypothetical protein [Streptomyces sp. NPDC059970]|uniref:hypothetical protein n=1 Tax=Streptomyces sp. NPDC059970 TaxID=3347019 RepID=UPI0036BF631C